MKSNAKMYITFFAGPPSKKPKLPIVSSQKDIEVFRINNQDALSLGHIMQNERFGFPNNFIEKELGVLATTRNWTTISKIIDSN